MRICYFGTYESKYPRNRIIIEALKQNGAEIIECHVPLWELTEHKTGKYLYFTNLALIFLRMVSAYIRLINMYLRLKRIDIIIVGYIGQIDVFIAKLLILFSRTRLVFNPNISLYYSMVEDRKLIRKNSITAWGLYNLEKCAFRLCDLVILDTQAGIDDFKRDFGLEEKRLLKIYVGADDSVFTGINTNKRDLTGEEFTVLFFGKFIPLHGIEYILHAAKQISNEAVRFIILGDGQLYQAMASLKQELGLKKVAMPGWVQSEEIPSYLAAADICLGIFGITRKAQRVIPNKVYQAVAMGVPVITGNTAAAREVFRNMEDVVLCDTGDYAGLARSILMLKNNAALRKSIAERGKKLYLSRFTTGKLGVELIKGFSLIAPGQ